MEQTAGQTVRHRGRSAPRPARQYTVSDSSQINNISCRSEVCNDECWVADFSKSDNKLGAQFRKALKENHFKCRNLEKTLLKLNPNYLHLHNGKCHSLVDWGSGYSNSKHITLLDTGSEATIISEEFAVQNLKLKPEDWSSTVIELNGASGTALEALGSVYLDINLAGNTKNRLVYIVRQPLILIGSPTLVAHKTILNMSLGRVVTDVPSNLIKKLHKIGGKIDLPKSYKLSLLDIDFYAPKVLTYRVQATISELKNMNYCEMVIYCCKDECEADIYTDTTTTCPCAGEILCSNFVVNDLVKIRKTNLTKPITEYSRMKCYLYQKPPEFTIEEEELLNGKLEEEENSSPKKSKETQYNSNQQEENNKNEELFSFENNKVKKNINIMTGQPAGVTLYDNGEVSFDPPQIHGAVDIEFTAGDPISLHEAMKSIICIQCQVYDEAYELCDLENKLCSTRKNIINVQKPNAHQWTVPEITTFSSSIGETNVIEIVSNDIFNSKMLHKYPTIMNEDIRLVKNKKESCYYVRKNDFNIMYKNVVRITNHLIQLGYENVLLKGWENVGLAATYFKEVFTDIKFHMLQTYKPKKNNSKVKSSKIIKHSNIAKGVLNIKTAHQKEEEPEVIERTSEELLKQLTYSGPEEFRKEMENLILEMDTHEGKHLTSMWTKHNTDIGVFHNNKPPFQNFIMKFPFKKENHVWRPEKIKPTPEHLIGPATKLLDLLVAADVCRECYTPFQNRCRFVTKPNLQISEKEWVALGNKPEDYKAGMTGVQSGGVRLVTDTFQSSAMCEFVPFTQLAIPDQLGKITTGTKYVSVIDLSNAFFHIIICDKSAQTVGFNPGLPHRGIFVYRRLPMGHSTSVGGLCSALMVVLGGNQKILQYSDNILILSDTAREAVDLITWTLKRLREFGWKAKLSKCCFCWDGQLQIFGYLVDLKNNTMRPNKEKLNALAATKQIANKTHLQRFLGILQFFSNTIPITTDALAILREPLKGHEWIWKDTHQKAFEDMLAIIGKPENLFVYLPNPNLPIWARCDSSARKSCCVVYQQQQIGEKILGPFPLGFMYKSWNALPNFHALTANKQELTGLLFMVRQMDACFPSHPEKRIIATDSVIIGLLSLAAKYNSTLADDRLFFAQLSNTEICWVSNLDLGMRTADWFTRTEEDFTVERKKHKRMTIKEIDEQLVQDTMRKLHLFKGSQPIKKVLYDISYLFDLDKEVLDQCDDNSVEINSEEGKVLATVNGVKKEISIDFKPPIADGLPMYHHSIQQTTDGLLRVQNVTIKAVRKNPRLPDPSCARAETRAKTTRDNELITQLKFEEKRASKNSVKMQAEEEENKFRCTKSKGLDLEGIFQGNPPPITVPPPPSWWNARAENTVRSVGNDIPNMMTDDILSLLCPIVDLNVTDPHKDIIIKNPKTEFEKYFNWFLYQSNLLNVTAFSKLVQTDPYFGEFYKRCAGGKAIYREGTPNTNSVKEYRVYRGILFCKTKMGKSIYWSYKVALPFCYAGDMVRETHINFGHPAELKLLHMTGQRWLINNHKTIVESVIKNCHPCNLMKAKLFGQRIYPRPKWTQSILNPGFAYYCDELTVFTGATKEQDLKLLVFTDCFSHFTIPIVLTKTLDSDYFMELFEDNIVKQHGFPYFLISDGARNISSSDIRNRCSSMNCNHVTLCRYRPSSNLTELMNQAILRCFRLVAYTENIEPTYLKMIVTRISHLCNTSPFVNCLEISPFKLFHPTKIVSYPSVMQTMEEVKGLFKNPSKNLEKQIELTTYLHGLRHKMIEARKYKRLELHHKSVHDDIQPGSLVLLRNFNKKNKRGFAHKLLGTYSGHFTVRARFGNTIWCSPSMPIMGANQIPFQPLLKTHITDATPCKTALAYPIDQKHGKYLEKFYSEHTIPTTKVLKYHEGMESDEGEYYQSGWNMEDWNEDLEEEEEVEKDEEVPKEIWNIILRYHKQINTAPNVESKKKKNNVNNVRFSLPKWRFKCSKIGTNAPCITQKIVAHNVDFSNVAYKYTLRCSDLNAAIGHREERIEPNFKPSVLCRTFVNQYNVPTRCSCNKCKIGLSHCKLTDCELCTHPIDKSKRI